MGDPGYLVFPREYWSGWAVKVHQGQRRGQAAFNTIHELWPEVADSLRGSVYDPFYNDSKMDAFLDEVMERLTRPKH